MSSDLTIVTGSDSGFMLWLVALLNSLHATNDIGARVQIMDFGLTPEDRDRLASHPLRPETVSAAAHYATILPFVDTTREMSRNERHMLVRYSKLAMALTVQTEWGLWIDADCLVLDKLSAFVPSVPVNELYARGGRDRLAAYSTLKASVPEGEAVELIKRIAELRGRDDEFMARFNSGVMLFRVQTLRMLIEKYKDNLLGRFYGNFLCDDQGFLNVAVTADDLKVGAFRGLVNTSPDNGEFSVDIDNRLAFRDGEPISVLHFCGPTKPGRPTQSPTQRHRDATALFERFAAS